MNTGIEILLKRIQDCPDDFQYDVSTDHSSKWNKLLMEALRSDVITEEEKTALRHEVTEMGRARFTERVMQALAGGEDETSDEGKSSSMPKIGTTLGGLTLTTNPNGNVTWANTATANSLTIGNTTLEEEQLKHIKAHLDYLNKTKVEAKKKATLR
jgi:hypothetical protein